ncbi:hypothetical protein [Nonomuraea soli]|uniref:Uncharacterized protein n=1 Tax=Nonomuraea soli TaxID=1032476 RepID=A0A7W0CSI9_9ACTN|nr:hypothetical protein [Nonomuraea soli]MBA2896418.1 hypothetical protein [Nonomuraea soli]
MAELIQHKVEPLTLSQLRELIKALPDSLVITVAPSVGPTGPATKSRSSPTPATSTAGRPLDG